MGWKTKSVVLVGLPILGACAAILYYIHKKEEDFEEQIDAKHLRNDVVRMNIPQASVGVVIGRGGATIKDIQLKSDTKIKFDEHDNNSKDFRICVIRGTAEGIQLAESMIHEHIMKQPLIETSEFWIPQNACGRVIGVGGENIRIITRTSNAKVTVDQTSLGKGNERRVVIKGTPTQISVAHAMIEEKVKEEFEQWRKMEHELASRSPRNKPKPTHAIADTQSVQADCNTLMPEKLIANNSDGSLQVYVSAVCSPNQFWLQVISPRAVELDHLVDQMTEHYSKLENSEIYTIKELRVGQIVAAQFDYDDKWYRAEVCALTADPDKPGESMVDLYYVDYGDSSWQPEAKIRQLRTDFLRLRFQAIECSLAKIVPRGGMEAGWSEESISAFEELCHVALWHPLLAHITSYKERTERSPSARPNSSLPCIELFDTSTPQDVNVGSELVKRGYAVWEPLELHVLPEPQ